MLGDARDELADSRTGLTSGFLVAAVGAATVVIALFLPHFSGETVRNERGTDDVAIVIAFGLPSVLSTAFAWLSWARWPRAAWPVAGIGALGSAITLLALTSEGADAVTAEVGAWLVVIGFAIQLAGGALMLAAAKWNRMRAAGRTR